jgi:hypothetical protein
VNRYSQTSTKILPIQRQFQLNSSTKAEIIIAVQELNKVKAPGIDNVTTEVLKIYPELTANFFNHS